MSTQKLHLKNSLLWRVFEDEKFALSPYDYEAYRLSFYSNIDEINWGWIDIQDPDWGL